MKSLVCIFKCQGRAEAYWLLKWWWSKTWINYSTLQLWLNFPATFSMLLPYTSLSPPLHVRWEKSHIWIFCIFAPLEILKVKIFTLFLSLSNNSFSTSLQRGHHFISSWYFNIPHCCRHHWLLNSIKRSENFKLPSFTFGSFYVHFYIRGIQWLLTCLISLSSVCIL